MQTLYYFILGIWNLWILVSVHDAVDIKEQNVQDNESEENGTIGDTDWDAGNASASTLKFEAKPWLQNSQGHIYFQPSFGEDYISKAEGISVHFQGAIFETAETSSLGTFS